MLAELSHPGGRDRRDPGFTGRVRRREQTLNFAYQKFRAHHRNPPPSRAQ
jgi:hypothetical protein